MEVVATLNRRDLFVGNFFNLYRRLSLWGISALPGLVFVSAEWPEGAKRVGPLLATVVLAALFILITLAFQLVGVTISSTIAALRPGRLPGVLGRHVYRILDTGFHEETDVNANTVAWSGIANVRAALPGVLVQLPSASGHFIPKRFFRDRAHLREFAQVVARGISNGRARLD
jgi:hypothetical protein